MCVCVCVFEYFFLFNIFLTMIPIPIPIMPPIYRYHYCATYTLFKTSLNSYTLLKAHLT